MKLGRMAVAVEVSNDWMILRRTLHLCTQGKGSVVIRVGIGIGLAFERCASRYGIS